MSNLASLLILCYAQAATGYFAHLACLAKMWRTWGRSGGPGSRQVWCCHRAANKVLIPNLCNLNKHSIMMPQAAPSIIPCWAAGLTFGVLQLLPFLDHHIACCYTPPILQVLLRRRIRRHYKIQVSCNTWSWPDCMCLVSILRYYSRCISAAITTCNFDTRMFQTHCMPCQSWCMLTQTRLFSCLTYYPSLLI